MIGYGAHGRVHPPEQATVVTGPAQRGGRRPYSGDPAVEKTGARRRPRPRREREKTMTEGMPIRAGISSVKSGVKRY